MIVMSEVADDSRSLIACCLIRRGGGTCVFYPKKGKKEIKSNSIFVAVLL
jgi:hypothetical protein